MQHFENTCEMKMAQFKINKEYAAKYKKAKERQELEKLKQKYGDEEEAEDSSTSESEDEDAEADTPQLEKDFLKMLSMIKKRDPKIYEKDAQFYDSKDDDEKDGIKEDQRKPLYLKDYERERLLQRGVKALVSDSESEDEENGSKGKESNMTYIKEQQMLKESFKNFVEDEGDGDDEEFLTLRTKTTAEKAMEEADYKEWLKSDDAMLRPGSVDDDDMFLRNYILKKEYLEQDDDGIPAYDQIVEEESEEEVDREEEFERKFNFRFEEPDQEFIKRFPRTIKESVRRTDDARKKKRKLREDRKKKEKETKKEEIKKLKNLKRKEIMEKIDKLKEITGNAKVGFMEEDLDGDFDGKKFDKLMNEIYDNEYYDAEDNEKPVFDDEEYYDDWDEWTGENEDYQCDAAQAHCEDPGFNMDADYVPAKKAIQVKSKAKLAEALSKEKPVFNPEEKTFEEYFDEYYKLDYEDLIGDLPVRFKYREVLSNNFGLSTEEILNANDRELNQWCSLTKASKYYSTEEELRERQRYKKKARSQQRKKRVFPTIYGEGESSAQTDGKDKPEGKTIPSISGRRNHLTILKARSSTFGAPRARQLNNFKAKHRKSGHRASGSRHGATLKNISDERLAAYGLGTKRKRSKQ